MGKSVKTVDDVVIPDELAAALATHSKARAAFAVLQASHQREYVKWIKDAKKSATRQRRSAKAVQMLLDRKHM